MSGLPRTSARNTAGVCTGDWACDVDETTRHCVCVEDHTPRPGRTIECCQCGSPRGEHCISCGLALTNHDPATTTLGPRCARCFIGRR